jgi:hypothetical protein
MAIRGSFTSYRISQICPGAEVATPASQDHDAYVIIQLGNVKRLEKLAPHQVIDSVLLFWTVHDNGHDTIGADQLYGLHSPSTTY